MAPRRLSEGLFLVSAWIEEVLQSNDLESDARVAAKRGPRDSYSHDRPLLATGLRLPRPLFSDVKELSPLLEGDERAPLRD